MFAPSFYSQIWVLADVETECGLMTLGAYPAGNKRAENEVYEKIKQYDIPLEKVNINRVLFTRPRESWRVLERPPACEGGRPCVLVHEVTYGSKEKTRAGRDSSLRHLQATHY